MLLICTSVFVISSLIAGWFEWDNGKAYALISYEFAFFIGLFVSLMGIPLALVGVVWCKRDLRTALVSIALLLSSIAFVLTLAILPVVKHHNLLGAGK